MTGTAGLGIAWAMGLHLWVPAIGLIFVKRKLKHPSLF